MADLASAMPAFLVDDAAMQSPVVASPADGLENLAGNPVEFVAALDKHAQAAAAAKKTAGDDMSEQVSKPGQEDAVASLRQALDQGAVDPRSALGQKFNAWLREHEDQRHLYDSLKGCGSNKAKQEFRLKWAKTELAGRITLRKSRLQTLEETLGERGVYMSFDRLVILEGGYGLPGAIARAAAYAAEAVSRGEPYISWNSWKRTTEILVFEKIRDRTTTDSYQIERHPKTIQNSRARAHTTTSGQDNLLLRN